jgi:(p)ppGpp synthase/HD superfamily hydrolase
MQTHRFDDALAGALRPQAGPRVPVLAHLAAASVRAAEAGGRLTLERAVALAAEAHAGQTDKAGAPYILHPLRVMLAQQSEEARIVGVLHDVVEDTPVRLDHLAAMGTSEAVLRGLDAVTRRDGESYEAYVARAGTDPLGRMVKIADLRDNMDLTRLAAPTGHDHARIGRYRAALAALGV